MAPLSPCLVRLLLSALVTNQAREFSSYVLHYQPWPLIICGAKDCLGTLSLTSSAHLCSSYPLSICLPLSLSLSPALLLPPPLLLLSPLTLPLTSIMTPGTGGWAFPHESLHLTSSWITRDVKLFSTQGTREVTLLSPWSARDVKTASPWSTTDAKLLLFPPLSG